MFYSVLTNKHLKQKKKKKNSRLIDLCLFVTKVCLWKRASVVLSLFFICVDLFSFVLKPFGFHFACQFHTYF